jgi:hypothetical protein
MEHIAKLLVDPSQNLVSNPLLIIVLEIVAPSWAISNIHAREKLVVLDQT